LQVKKHIWMMLMTSHELITAMKEHHQRQRRDKVTVEATKTAAREVKVKWDFCVFCFALFSFSVSPFFSVDHIYTNASCLWITG